MKTYKATLQSVSPYSQGKHYEVDKLPKEQADAYERRTWRNRMHVDDNGEVFIPPTAVKNCLAECAKYLSKQIPGKGKATYTKHMEAGVMVVEPLGLGIKADKVEGVARFVPASGRRGDGRRVTRVFPEIPSWQATATIHVLDETVTAEVLREHLDEAGKLIGIGVFRPRNNGYFGRFKVIDFKEV